MKGDTQRPFVEKVAQDTRDYVQSLLDEVQRLSSAVAELEVEIRTRHERELRLAQHMAAVESESRQFATRYAEVEQQNSNLANLYVASYQLNGTLDRERVTAAMMEIVINLIGSEQLVIWEAEGDDQLRHVASFGVDPAEWSSVAADNSVIGLCLRTRTRFIAGESPIVPTGKEKNLTACIPLLLDERLVGMVAIFELLPQKEGLAPVDYELFDLLASHAATALYCTRRPAPREGDAE